MEDGYLYCHKCGKAIQIVPNFEPEIEDSIDRTLSSIVDDVISHGENKKTKEDIQGKKKTFSARILLLLIVLSVLVVITGVTIVVLNSYSYQSDKADRLFSEGKYSKAIEFYQKALDKEDSVALEMKLAEAYLQVGLDTDAVAILQGIVAKDPGNEEAYRLLFQTYEMNLQYDEINFLLASCSDQNIYEKYKDYLALPPEFSIEEGTYKELLSLNLMTNDIGTIYYTIDGSEPNTSSIKYEAPIELQNGNNVIKAVFVNQKGIVSDSVQKKYTIQLEIPSIPVITPKSNIFSSPEYISVEVPEGGNVYYTTDGTVPTIESERYTGPIPMPLGESHFRFITETKDKIVSAPGEATYSLSFPATYTKEEAVNYVIATLLLRGELLDVNGSVPDLEGHYLYTCTSAAKAGSQIYYLVDELYKENESSQTSGESVVKTGKMYAVDTQSGGLYRVAQKASGNYEFEVFY